MKEKKHLFIVILVLTLVFAFVGLVASMTINYDNSVRRTNPGFVYRSMYQLYEANAEEGGVGAVGYEEWIESIKGKDGVDGAYVSGSTINEDGELIVTLSNGNTINCGVVRGAKGKDGVSVVGVSVNGSGELIITLSEGEPINVGKITGADGVGISNAEVRSSDGHLIVYYTNESEKDLGVVVGANGANGLSAYEVWLAQEGNEGKDVEDYLLSLKGAQGDQGDQGATGMSAYEYWCSQQAEGADKTPEAYFLSLKGEDGLSAYEVWLAQDSNAVKGVEDYLKSLKGDTGVGISKIEKSGDNLVITLTEGDPITIEGIVGEKGADGKDGNGITGITMTDGVLKICTDNNTDGYTFNVKGDKGDTGVGITNIAKSADGTGLVFTLTDASDTEKTITIPDMKGDKGDKGADGNSVTGFDIDADTGVLTIYTTENTEGTSLGKITGNDGLTPKVTLAANGDLKVTYVQNLDDVITEELTTVDLGNIKGKDGVSVTKVEINSSNELVITLSEGEPINLGNIKGADGANGTNGLIPKVSIDNAGNLKVAYVQNLDDEVTESTPTVDLGNIKGKDGVSVTKVEINASNELVITLSEGEPINLGNVKGADGANGTNGLIPKVTLDEDGNLSVTYVTELEDVNTTVNLGNIKGAKGDKGDKGEDGISITDVKIENDKLMVKLSNSENYIELGNVKGDQGATGATGATGKGIKSVAIVCGSMTITYDDNSTVTTLENVLPEAGHTWNGGVQTTDPTCTTAGVMTYTCTAEGCNKTKTVLIDATNMHTNETCYNDTQHYYQCTFCGAIDGEKANHTYNETATVEIAATCTSVGHIIKSCTGCGHVHDEITEALGHKPTDVSYNESTHKFICEVCHQTIEELHNGDNCSICRYSKDYTSELIFELNNANQTYTVTGISVDTVTAVKIPSYYKGLPVATIGAQAFAGNTAIKTIILPNTIKAIGANAFNGCSDNLIVYYTGTSAQWARVDGCENYTVMYYSETAAGGCWHYVDGAPTEWYSEGLKFTEIKDTVDTTKTVAYSVANGECQETNIIIPAYYQGLPVTTIADYGFEDKEITSIILPNTITTIGVMAFTMREGITDIDIPESVTIIGMMAFADCSNLKNITIPNSVTMIGDSAFSGCTSLESVVLPANLTSIGENLFNTCSSLTYINIPNGVQTIGVQSLAGCAFTSVVLPDSVTTIGDYAFAVCTSLASISIPDSVTTIGANAFDSCSSLTSVILPASVTTIGSNAFKNCPADLVLYYKGTSAQWAVVGGNADAYTDKVAYYSATKPTEAGMYWHYDTDGVTPTRWGSYGLKYELTFARNAYEVSLGTCTETNVYIPATYNGLPVNAIGSFEYGTFTSISLPNTIVVFDYNVFNYCESLKSIHVPASVLEINGSVFGFCPALESITVDPANPVFSSAGNCLIDIETKTLMAGCKNSSIPDDGSVTIIGDNAFNGCVSLTSITIPNGITEIGSGAFKGCTNLTSIAIPNSITTISWAAFQSCTSLQSVNLGNGLQTINMDAFKGCTSLKNINLGNSVTSIGQCAFSGCTSLTSIAIPNTVTIIANYAFENCTSLTSINLGNGLKIIATGAFSGCTKLKSVVLPTSVTEIGIDAFGGCHADLVLYYNGTSEDWESVTGNGKGACAERVRYYSETFKVDDWHYNSNGEPTIWAYNTDLDYTPIIENDVTVAYAVSYGGTATEIAIPDTHDSMPVTTIKNSGFESKTTITSVYLPNTITKIGNAAFAGCTSLQNIVIPDSVTTIDTSAFAGCTSLNSVTIPDGVTTIANKAFNGCESLESITIPDGVTTIGNYAFQNCESLTSVKMSSVVQTIGDKAFRNTGVIELVLPTSVTTIGEKVFGYDRDYNPDPNVTIYYRGGYENWQGVALGLNSEIKAIYLYSDEAIGGCWHDVNGVPTAYPYTEGLKYTELLNSENSAILGYKVERGDATSTDIVIPTYHMGKKVTEIGDNSFKDPEDWGYLTSIVMPETITTIGAGAFSGCGQLASVVLPASLQTIGENAFEGCSELASITIPDSVTTIDVGAFGYCTNLQNIVIPDSVQTIGERAFSYCANLVSVVLPVSVKSIDNDAFSGCHAELKLYYKGTSVQWTGVSVSNYYMDTVLYYSEDAIDGCWHYDENGVPTAWIVSQNLRYTEITDDSGTAVAYSVSYGTCTDTDVIIPAYHDGLPVTAIADNGFATKNQITSVYLPNTIITIGVMAFYMCTGLASITIPDSVTTIGNDAFASCINLESLVIPDGVTTIGAEAFMWCTGLESITLGNGLQTIGNTAFYECTSLVSVVLPTSLQSIGEGAFYSCTSLESVVLPVSVKSIYNDAFKGCHTELKLYYKGTSEDWSLVTGSGKRACETKLCYYSETFADGMWYYDADGVPTIWAATADLVFAEIYDSTDETKIVAYSVSYGTCTDTDVIIPAYHDDLPVTTIADQGFAGKAITSIYLPNTITTIGNAAFFECTSLQNIVIPDSVTTIGDEAFTICEKLASINIPNSVTTIGGFAFGYCKSLQNIVIPDSVESIGLGAFSDCTRLETVYFGGADSAAWDTFKSKIDIGDNAYLLNATVYYYSEEMPTEAGNYWHYDDNGVPTIWEQI